MKSRGKRLVAITTMMGVAFIATTVVSPPPAKADATLAAALGGTALLGLILHSQTPSPPQQFVVQPVPAPYFRPVPVYYNTMPVYRTMYPYGYQPPHIHVHMTPRNIYRPW